MAKAAPACPTHALKIAPMQSGRVLARSKSRFKMPSDAYHRLTLQTPRQGALLVRYSMLARSVAPAKSERETQGIPKEHTCQEARNDEGMFDNPDFEDER